MRATTTAAGRRGRRSVRRTLAVTLGVLVAAVATATPAGAEANRTVAFYSLDEPAGATTLVDSTGNHHGSIGSEVAPGTIFQGATAHRFATHLPGEMNFNHGHVDTVPNTQDFDPESGDFTVSIRYRTGYSFGNIFQKGQGSTPGGYWKFEAPGGEPLCMFRGGNGATKTAWARWSLADDQWHTVTCNRTSQYVEMYVDGVRHSRNWGSSGNIDNNWQLAIGGKSSCGGSITCDYFAGDIDFVKIRKGTTSVPNDPPVASLSTTCTGLTCSFSGASSTDSDGAIQDHGWDFGDGTSQSTASVSEVVHTFAQPGTYLVRMTVTDDEGDTDTDQEQVTVAPIPEVISFVGANTANGNLVTHTVAVPGSVQAGDVLVMFLSQNNDAGTSDPTGVTGWTRLDRVVGGYARTTAWSKVATAGDAGDVASVALSRRAKGNLVVAAYRGVDPTDPISAFAGTTDPVPSNERVTPLVAVDEAQSWGVSYWLHGDSSTSALTPPPGVAVRSNSSQTGGGRVTGLLADSAASLPPGSYGNLTATAPSSGFTTTTWTLILRPGASGPPPPNQPPSAAISADCTNLTCTLDASGSSDSDGTIVEYAFDPGDGSAPASGATETRPHTYGAAGTYTASVTVTDDDGATDSAEVDVTVNDPPPPTGDPVEFVGAGDSTGNLTSHSATVPSAVQAGDVLLAFFTGAKATTVSDPGGGWVREDTASESSMVGALWSKVADAGDAGSTVTIDAAELVKGSLVVAAYRNVAPTDPVMDLAWAAQPTSADRTTPVVAVADTAAWAVSLWSHRDSASTSFTVPSGVVERASTSQTGGGRITAMLGDSGGPVGAASYGGLVATADAGSSRGITWTVLLRPAS